MDYEVDHPLVLCPRCGDIMAPGRAHDGVEPRECVNGHGVFLTASEAEALFAAPALDALEGVIPDAAEGDVDCPDCATRMHAFTVTYRDGTESSVQPALLELDGCAQCGGLWFDRGELDELRHAGDEHLVAGETEAREPVQRRPWRDVLVNSLRDFFGGGWD